MMSLAVAAFKATIDAGLVVPVEPEAAWRSAGMVVLAWQRCLCRSWAACCPSSASSASSGTSALSAGYRLALAPALYLLLAPRTDFTAGCRNLVVFAETALVGWVWKKPLNRATADFVSNICVDVYLNAACDTWETHDKRHDRCSI
jgi:hypothetical protein